MTGSFNTTANAQEVKPGQPLAPVLITINDRAATREAIIRKVQELGHSYVSRSAWGAVRGNDGMDCDWDYTMVALHHAGRSYECSGGSQQMLETQEEHMGQGYDDIGYHFGIDCSGVIYEGRDIRLKGSSVRNYNTGVIGIVLLNNLATAEEGGGIVALGRELLESLGHNTTNTIPAAQINGVVNLITALKSVFVIKHFGGHREYPGQSSDGKICPGNVGMELVRAIRSNTGLLFPPSS
ncbi:MAG: peptidoglycan recognition protein family protein [Gammaproteobacteria bacterium]|nr:peptidoglycan recognition protein family protein [Gammaproteobacteria bacterium]MBU1491864.1 peptidoglycan recognition protein family protein [Gammaproteobacteria bacterium]MBU2322918.1 peptidoglycan recognition protein family protein [Gammaproteobacteria bacterium]